MKLRWTTLPLALTLTVACASMQVYVDYDRNADVDSYRTFGWSGSTEPSLQDTSPLMDARVRSAIERKLRSSGLRLVDSDPDLYVAYYTEENDELRLDTTHFGYGYGAGWYWDPYGPWAGGGLSTSQTTVRSYTRGTLIIDLWDAKTKQLVWRGTAEDVVPENPEKAARKIDEAVAKMSDEFKKMRKKG